MEVMLKPKGTLLALFMFMPITPSIVAITVFIKSVLIDKIEDFTEISLHSK